jgi:hypothetical protein
MGKNISEHSKTKDASKRWRRRNRIHLDKARDCNVNVIKSIAKSKQKIISMLQSQNHNPTTYKDCQLVDSLNLVTSGAECETVWSSAKQLEFHVLAYIRLVELLCGVQ